MITNPQSVITANNITDNYEYLAKLKKYIRIVWKCGTAISN